MTLGVMSPRGPFRQAPRLASDGEISVRIVVDHTDGVEKVELAAGTGVVVLSEFNAARAFGCLAMMLGIRLPTAIGRAIKLGSPFEARIG